MMQVIANVLGIVKLDLSYWQIGVYIKLSYLEKFNFVLPQLHKLPIENSLLK
jgi:hypothetical protein